jgi:hypothetical protein
VLTAIDTEPYKRDVLWQDRVTRETKIVSLNWQKTARANRTSTLPQISGDGRYVVFRSAATDVVTPPTGGGTDLYVWDRVTGAVLLISRGSNPNARQGRNSSRAVLAADGRTVLFQSTANDLVPGDFNDITDIFVMQFGTGDSDNDGIEDGWEIGYFGDLSRDGSGDLDSDGSTDSQEFLAGTDPSNIGSVLRVLTIRSMAGGPTTVLWAATPGKNYRVDCKDNLRWQWRSLTNTVSVTGTEASLIDNSRHGSQRYYRVVVLP